MPTTRRLKLTFEALKPFRLRLRGQVRIIGQGQAIELDTAEGERLLQRAPGLVRLVPRPVVIGHALQWCSPLFGNLQGMVLLADEDAVLVQHPTIAEPAWICRSWITGAIGQM